MLAEAAAAMSDGAPHPKRPSRTMGDALCLPDLDHLLTAWRLALAMMQCGVGMVAMAA